MNLLLNKWKKISPNYWKNVSIVPADKVLGLPEVEIQFYSSFALDSKKWTISSVRTSEFGNQFV
jgi:hypothetical protein